MRLIDADEFVNEIYKCVMYGNTAYVDKYEVIHRLNNVPTIEAEPTRHGRWIGKPTAGYSTVRCSVCRDVFLENNGKWEYCPHCGARMDEMNDEAY